MNSSVVTRIGSRAATAALVSVGTPCAPGAALGAVPVPALDGVGTPDEPGAAACGTLCWTAGAGGGRCSFCHASQSIRMEKEKTMKTMRR